MNFIQKYLYDHCAQIPFFLLFCIIVMLIAFSIIGTQSTDTSLYVSAPAVALWACLAISSTGLIIGRKMYKRIPTFVLHLALLLILSGAFISHLYGYGGTLHLRQGDEADTFMAENDIQEIPFTVRLDSFIVILYPGTQTPSDFQSHITIDGKESHLISMNNIYERDGFRFYQTSFDEDSRGTIISVRYDKWGTLITYCGYTLLFTGMIMILFAKRSIFRKLLKDKSWQAFSILLLFSPNVDANATSRTLSKDEAEAFGDLLVLYQGRITTLESMAIDFTRKLTGSSSYADYTPTQVMAGWLFSREEWQYEPMINIKPTEREILGAREGKVRFVDFFTEERQYKPRMEYLRLAETIGKDKALEKILNIDSKAQAILQLQSGDLLKIFPQREGVHVFLLSPTESVPYAGSESDSLLAKHFLPLLYDSYSKGEDCSEWLRKFATYQREQLGDNVPSSTVLNAEKIYYKINIVPIISHITLTLGMLAFILLLGRGKDWRTKFWSPLLVIASIITIHLTLILTLRSVVSGHLPLSNGYETLLCIAWLSLIVSIISYRKVRILLPLGILASGFALLAATMADKDPQLTPLVPVLRSPLLTIHVFLMMVSYTLLLIITISSIVALFRRTEMEALQKLNTVFLYPAIFTLTAGIFIGAVWANISWGSYWSWDPKETWALITLLVYSFSFHSTFITALKKPLAFHIYLTVAFLFVLLTYFGVNYIFGGMHSYSS